MLVIELVRWWYVDGYKNFINKLFKKIGDTIDFFSIKSLIRTIFASYKQISVSNSNNSNVMQIFMDRLINRMVGATIRILIIIAGLIVLIIQILVSLALIIIWPFLPIMPLACLAIAMAGGIK